MIKGKHILLCVTRGVAAYKAAALTSQLTQRGAEVKVIMTEGACQFITPLTFQALSRQEVYVDTFAENNPAVIAHIDLADWADLVLVAPATANTIAKLAAGIADNMVTTTILATKAPVWIAPAMNVHMYEHPAVQANIERLYQFGYRFIEPSEGYLACSYIGKGRLEEPEKTHRPYRARFLPVIRRCFAGSVCLSPLGRRGRGLIQSAISPTIRAAKWATPSPKRRPASALR